MQKAFSQGKKTNTEEQKNYRVKKNAKDQNLKQERIDEEKSDLLYECDLCGKRYRYKSNLKDHIEAQHMNNYFSCNSCRKKYKSKKLLHAHIRAEHCDLKPILCEVCGRFNKNLLYHKKHHKRCTLREIDASCSVCNQILYSKRVMQDHMLLHIDEKHYICDVYSMAFAQRQGLYKHWQKKHPGQPCPKSTISVNSIVEKFLLNWNKK